MASSSTFPPVPVEALREVVRRAVERDKMRKVAREIGISLGGLHGFLAGSAPQQATMRKVREWYVRGAARTGEVTDDAARSAIATLLGGIGRGKERDEALETILGAVSEAHRKQLTEQPGWIANLKGWEWE